MSENIDDYRSSTEGATTTQWIDGRVLPDEPIVKTSNPYQSHPEYICPHCVCNVTPQSSVWDDPDEEEGVPAEVERHIRTCSGLEPYHLGLKARRKQKARELAKQR